MFTCQSVGRGMRWGRFILFLQGKHHKIKASHLIGHNFLMGSSLVVRNAGNRVFIWVLCGCSVSKSYLNLCDPMDYTMPGSSVLHYLPEFAQKFKYSTHIIYNGHSLFYLTTIYTYVLFVECLLSLKHDSRWWNTSSEQNDKAFTFMELATL